MTSGGQNLKNLVGQRFGKLVVIERAGSKNGRATWLAQCDCGNTKVVLGKNLLNGTCKSCGCLHKEQLTERNTEDITGQRFGRLVAIKVVGKRRQENLWLTQCDCGNTKLSTVHDLRSGTCKSCGCLHDELAKERMTTHGLSDTRIYSIYQGMKMRCYNENEKSYKYYGAKGTTVCEEWYDSFEDFYKWAMENGYDDTLTIDRINPYGNYEPSNCRWVTWEVQHQNTKRNYLDKSQED